jgi:hypothetical protein
MVLNYRDTKFNFDWNYEDQVIIIREKVIFIQFVVTVFAALDIPTFKCFFFRWF